MNKYLTHKIKFCVTLIKSHNRFRFNFHFIIADFNEDFYRYALSANNTGHITPLYQPNVGLYDYNLMMEWILSTNTGQVLLLNVLYIDVIETDADICFEDFLRVG